MKYRLTPAFLLLFICFISVTNVAESRQGNRFSYNDFEKNVKARREPKREFNATSTLKSAKLGNHLLKDNAIDRHPSLRVENFETRLNHFSTDDQRTVEFVRFTIYFC